MAVVVTPSPQKVSVANHAAIDIDVSLGQSSVGLALQISEIVQSQIAPLVIQHHGVRFYAPFPTDFQVTVNAKSAKTLNPEQREDIIAAVNSGIQVGLMDGARAEIPPKNINICFQSQEAAAHRDHHLFNLRTATRVFENLTLPSPTKK